MFNLRLELFKIKGQQVYKKLGQSKKKKNSWKDQWSRRETAGGADWSLWACAYIYTQDGILLPVYTSAYIQEGEYYLLAQRAVGRSNVAQLRHAASSWVYVTCSIIMLPQPITAFKPRLYTRFNPNTDSQKPFPDVLTTSTLKSTISVVQRILNINW